MKKPAAISQSAANGDRCQATDSSTLNKHLVKEGKFTWVLCITSQQNSIQLTRCCITTSLMYEIKLSIHVQLPVFYTEMEIEGEKLPCKKYTA